jgi:6-phosphogluconolactonase
VYRFDPSDGSMCLLNIQGNPSEVMNPAFSRYNPEKNVVYTCTEDCTENGKIFAYKLGQDGTLTQLGEPVDAGGTSTCYLTLSKDQRHLLAVNYWDSTLVTFPLSTETGEFLGPIKSKYDPKQGKGMVAGLKTKGGVNHSCNDENTIKMRQADPHSHALVLDPYHGVVSYVPDLGKDLIREFYYDRHGGRIDMEMNYMPSGLCTGKPDGPRYIHFHPKYNVAYVVNELSSTVSIKWFS